MKSAREDKVFKGMFVVSFFGAFYVTFTQFGLSPEPAWSDAFKSANAISTSAEYEKWDRQAKLVLAESNRYGGEAPPRSTRYAWTYPAALGDLAKSYEYHHHLEEAECFYRKALEMEIKEKTSYIPSYRQNLIRVLKEQNKKPDEYNLPKEPLNEDQSVSTRVFDSVLNIGSNRVNRK